MATTKELEAVKDLLFRTNGIEYYNSNQKLLGGSKVLISATRNYQAREVRKLLEQLLT